MTDLSKLSIPELRAEMQGPAMDLLIFDELAERYRRLEAQRGVITPGEALWILRHMEQIDAHEEALRTPTETRARIRIKLQAIVDAPLPPSVSEGDKHLVRECNELMTLFSSHRDSREFRVAAALKRRIEGG